jgi:hypothetical protein
MALLAVKPGNYWVYFVDKRSPKLVWQSPKLLGQNGCRYLQQRSLWIDFCPNLPVRCYNVLPSHSEKFTSLRGYSKRKIKILPQADGRGLGFGSMLSHLFTLVTRLLWVKIWCSSWEFQFPIPDSQFPIPIHPKHSSLTSAELGAVQPLECVLAL